MGKEFCEEFCDVACAAESAVPRGVCCFEPPAVMRANRRAWECFKNGLWVYSSSGMGDAAAPALFWQTTLADLGLTGAARIAQMDKLMILDEELRKASALRQKRKRPNEAGT